MTWYMKAESPRLATSAGSRLRIVPAAALRGLAKSGSSCSSRSRFIRAKDVRGRYTSPRTSTLPAGPARSVSGIARIVRTFAVTSSPRTPSPRVAPRTRRPVVVGQGDAQPVDLHLGDVDDGGVAERADLAHAVVECLQLLLAVCVVQAEHRHRVLDGREALDRAVRRHAASASQA